MTHGQVMDALKLAERLVEAQERQAQALERLSYAVANLGGPVGSLSRSLKWWVMAQQGEPLKGQAHGNPGSQVKDGAVVVPSIPPQPGFDGKGKPKRKGRK